GFQLGDEAKKEEDEYEAKCQEVLAELKDHFRPEFLNRVDHLIVFNALNQQHIRRIVKMHLEELGERLKKQGFSLSIEQKAVNHLAEEGFDPEYGARPVRRVVQEEIEAEIAEHILKGIFQKGDTIRVTLKKGKLEFMPSDGKFKEPEEEEVEELATA
ncbi:ATP-dependent Clp protease ATP-binding subunit, partial [Candidatus Peregrinibacteria bacterium]|nr:ATP-dependent Clp protease ATP-binding subunit [Candidatus Peregrinibacteria bacterium]